MSSVPVTGGGALDAASKGAGSRSQATVRLGPRSVLTLSLASLAGLTMFLWPLLSHPKPGVAHGSVVARRAWGPRRSRTDRPSLAVLCAGLPPNVRRR